MSAFPLVKVPSAPMSIVMPSAAGRSDYAQAPA